MVWIYDGSYSWLCQRWWWWLNWFQVLVLLHHFCTLQMLHFHEHLALCSTVSVTVQKCILHCSFFYYHNLSWALGNDERIVHRVFWMKTRMRKDECNFQSLLTSGWSSDIVLLGVCFSILLKKDPYGEHLTCEINKKCNN